MSDCPLPPGSRVVAYFRDSGGDGQERSVGQQRRVADGYCAENHLVLQRVFADEARVGKTVVGRDQFEEMISYLRQLAPGGRQKRMPEAPDGVLLWDLKRFARNQIDGQYYKADLRWRGYTIIFLSDIIPDGDLAIVYESMLEWKAQQDLADISKDVRRGLEDLVATLGEDGRYLGLCPGRPPMGFKGEPYTLPKPRRDGRTRVVQRWVQDLETWDTCQQAWRLRLAKASYRKVHDETGLFRSLNCYPTFFSNRIYTGVLEYGGKEYIDFVPAMVTREEFEAVQAMRQPRRERRPRLDSSDYPLSGLIYCAECGRPMKADSIPPRADGGDGYPRRRHRRYTCTGWKQNRNCSMHYLTADLVEQAVFAKVAAEVLIPAHMADAVRLARPNEEECQDLERRIARHEQTLRELDTTIGHLVDAIEAAGMSPNLAKRLAEREAEQSEETHLLTNLRARLAQADTEPDPAYIEDFCSNGRTVLGTGDIDQIRDLLKLFIIRIEAGPRGGRLIYSFPTAGL